MKRPPLVFAPFFFHEPPKDLKKLSTSSNGIPTPYQIMANITDGPEIPATLEIVEWKGKVERKLLLCLPGRFSFHSMSPGIQARGFDFTAYLTADLFQQMADENREGFLAVSNSFTRDAEMDARQTGKPRGLVAEYDEPTKIRVWAKTWGQIIQEAEGRLTFYKRRLEYQANDAEALKYLRTINVDYLSEEVKAKIEALDREVVA
jgi:hypothetical protein